MQGFSGYSLQYSPFFDNKIAVATGANFGLVGNGKLFILDILPNGQMQVSNSFLTQDCLFGVAWNELHQNQMVVGQGDGTVRLFDMTLQKYPIHIFREHTKEVLSVNWNLLSKDKFVSSSWDGTVKLWSPRRPQGSFITLRPCQVKSTSKLDHVPPTMPISRHQRPVIQHNDPDANIGEFNSNGNADGRNNPKDNDKDQCIYQAQFSPHDDNVVISAGGNSFVSIFDLRTPNVHPQNNFLAHSGMETLCCDFNKYRPHIIATGGVDNKIKIWDLRMLRTGPLKLPNMFGDSMICVNEIVESHQLAVRQVKWSPHSSHHLLSTSYDMSAAIWDDLSFDGRKITGKTNMNDTIRRGCQKRFQKHTEFVFGGDWSLWGRPGIVATTGWDGNVLIWSS